MSCGCVSGNPVIWGPWCPVVHGYPEGLRAFVRFIYFMYGSSICMHIMQKEVSGPLGLE